MRNIKSKDKERKNNLNKLKIITILVVIFTIGFAIYCYINYDSNKKSLLDNGYVVDEDGTYKKSYITGGTEDGWPYNGGYYIITKDYSKISKHWEWRYNNKETGYLNQISDYDYSSLSNMATGSFYISYKEKELGNFYHASYDFNNGTLICDAPKTDCNMYIQYFSKLKEDYYLVINNK